VGGLSSAVLYATVILEAAGFDFIIVETVGAGQSDFDIMSIADIVAVVLAPALGDGLQGIKAGLMEIGDIFVMNKRDILDRIGAAASIDALKSALYATEPRPASSGLEKTVVQTIATSSNENENGVGELVKLVIEHKKAIESKGGNLEKIKRTLLWLKREEIAGKLNALSGSEELKNISERVARRELTLNEALKRIKL
ncbi:MAG: hypothetical protein QXU16_03470, partial [Candidatus Micrarchaeaceae archaeon]